MFRKNNGVEKRLRKISKQEAASIKLLEKQVKLETEIRFNCMMKFFVFVIM